jgi:hypothetical protein
MTPRQIVAFIVGITIVVTVFSPFSVIVNDNSGTTTVSDETLTADVGNFSDLRGYNIDSGSLSVERYNTTSDSYESVAGSDYELEADAGRLKPLASGAIEDGDELRVDYDYRVTDGTTTTIVEILPTIVVLTILGLIGLRLQEGM